MQVVSRGKKRPEYEKVTNTAGVGCFRAELMCAKIILGNACRESEVEVL